METLPSGKEDLSDSFNVRMCLAMAKASEADRAGALDPGEMGESEARETAEALTEAPLDQLLCVTGVGRNNRHCLSEGISSI